MAEQNKEEDIRYYQSVSAYRGASLALCQLDKQEFLNIRLFQLLELELLKVELLN